MEKSINNCETIDGDIYFITMNNRHLRTLSINDFDFSFSPNKIYADMNASGGGADI